MITLPKPLIAATEDLSVILFYPLADSLKDDSSIECDDHGAEYIEGRVKCILSDILKNPDTEMLKQFLAAAIESKEAAIGSQLVVQASLLAWQLWCAFHTRKLCQVLGRHYQKTLPVTAWGILT